MYMKRYYQEKWAPTVSILWKEYVDGPLDEGEKKARITFTMERCAEYLKKEPLEVQREVDRLMELQAKGVDVLMELGSNKEEEEAGDDDETALVDSRREAATEILQGWTK